MRTAKQGVAGYEHVPRQGPACAIAAGAARIVHNYFVPGGDRIGPTRDKQLGGLADFGARPAGLTDRSRRRPPGDAQRLCAVHEGSPSRHRRGADAPRDLCPGHTLRAALDRGPCRRRGDGRAGGPGRERDAGALASRAGRLSAEWAQDALDKLRMARAGGSLFGDMARRR